MKFLESGKRKSELAVLKKEISTRFKEPYEGFFSSFVDDCEYYTKENPELIKQLTEYLVTENPSLDDVLFYELYLSGLPYGDDNGKWYRWDTEITEEEAQKIVDEKYSE